MFYKLTNGKIPLYKDKLIQGIPLKIFVKDEEEF